MMVRLRKDFVNQSAFIQTYHPIRAVFGWNAAQIHYKYLNIVIRFLPYRIWNF